MNVDQKLKKIIKKISKQDIYLDKINDGTILTTDLGYDSVQIIELIVELEDLFNIEIDDDDMDIENLTVYGKLYEIVEKSIKRIK